MKVESQIGNIPAHAVEEVEPSLWASIAAITQKQTEAKSFETSNVWKKILQEYKGLYA